MWTYGIYRWAEHSPRLTIATDLGMALFCGVLFAASRDTLKKYRARIGMIAVKHQQPEHGDDAMTNGIDHTHGGPASSQPKPAPKVPATPKPAPTKPAEKA